MSISVRDMFAIIGIGFSITWLGGYFINGEWPRIVMATSTGHEQVERVECYAKSEMDWMVRFAVRGE